MQKTKLNILFLASGPINPLVVFDALKARYTSVFMVCEHYEDFDFLIPSANGHELRKFAFGRLPRYPRLLYFCLKTCLFVLRYGRRKKFDVCIVEGALFALIIPLFRRLGFVGKLVFYASDWFPKHALAQRLDRIAVHWSDETWNLAPSIVEGRRQRWGASVEKFDKVVPPIYKPRAEYRRAIDPDNLRCCYVGGIRRDVGLELVVKAISKLKAKGILLSLDIVGRDGVQKAADELKAIAKSEGVLERMRFHGFLELPEMEKILETAVCGIAIFLGGLENYSNWCNFGKLKVYLEYGVPLLISKAGMLADELVEKKNAVAVEESADGIAAALEMLCRNLEQTGLYSRNAYDYARERASPECLYQAIERITLANFVESVQGFSVQSSGNAP